MGSRGGDRRQKLEEECVYEEGMGSRGGDRRRKWRRWVVEEVMEVEEVSR